MDNQQKGILCVIAAMGIFSIQDSLIKGLSGEYPLHEVVLVRALVASVVLLIVMQYEGGVRALRTRRPGLHLGRGLLIVCANSCFFMGLASMPLAETMALFFVAPLFITVMSVVFLGEDVGIRRWAAIAVGMTGMLVVLRPGTSLFEPVALLPVAAAVAYSSMQMLTRKIGLEDQASTMAFYIQVTFIVVSSTVGLIAGDGAYAGSGNASLEFLLRAWRWPTFEHGALFVFIGAINAAGAYFMSQAYRSARASVVAPFEYVALPLGLLWGWLFWRDFPDAWAFLGIGLIIGSGIYVVYREGVRRRQRIAEEQTLSLPDDGPAR